MGHWIIDTAGIGSLIAGLVAVAVLLAYGSMMRWILTSPRPVKPAAQVEDSTGDEAV